MQVLFGILTKLMVFLLICNIYDYSRWTYLQNQNDCEDLMSMPMWWQQMMEDNLFTNHLNCRWNEINYKIN